MADSNLYPFIDDDGEFKAVRVRKNTNLANLPEHRTDVRDLVRAVLRDKGVTLESVLEPLVDALGARDKYGLIDHRTRMEASERLMAVAGIQNDNTDERRVVVQVEARDLSAMSDDEIAVEVQKRITGRDKSDNGYRPKFGGNAIPPPNYIPVPISAVPTDGPGVIGAHKDGDE